MKAGLPRHHPRTQEDVVSKCDGLSPCRGRADGLFLGKGGGPDSMRHSRGFTEASVVSCLPGRVHQGALLAFLPSAEAPLNSKPYFVHIQRTRPLRTHVRRMSQGTI